MIRSFPTFEIMTIPIALFVDYNRPVFDNNELIIYRCLTVNNVNKSANLCCINCFYSIKSLQNIKKCTKIIKQYIFN